MHIGIKMTIFISIKVSIEEYIHVTTAINHYWESIDFKIEKIQKCFYWNNSYFLSVKIWKLVVS